MHDRLGTSQQHRAGFSRTDLQPGDMLLLAVRDFYNHDKVFKAFMDSAIATLGAYADGATQKELLAAAGPMIQISIAIFDGDRFSHAALVTETTEARGELTVVEMGPGGMKATPLDDYLQKNGAGKYGRAIASVRYVKDHKELGSEGLPISPVVGVAQKLLDSGQIDYGFYNAFVLAIMCVWRKSQGLVLDELKARLKAYFGPKHNAAIDMFFTMCGGNLRDLLIKLSHVAGDYLRNKKELVCSEMVATCFNDAVNPVTGEAYVISLTRQEEIPLAGDAGFNAVPEEDMRSALEQLAEGINTLVYVPDLREPGLFFRAVSDDSDEPGWWGHNLYTPADLSKSISTVTLGDWDGT